MTVNQSNLPTIVLEIYAAIAGLTCLPIVRPPFARWYRSVFWLIPGRGPVEILMKQIGYKLGFELFIFAVSCIFGAIGGWVFALYKFSHRSNREPS